MGEKRYRVVVWATGWIGRVAIAAIHRRPDLELVGIWVHDPAKVGVDAGVLAGIGPIGCIATHDADALLTLAPDWPQADRDGTYKILIDGTPSMECTLTLGSPESASDDGMVASNA